MDKRISYKLIIDTETCPLDKTLKSVKPENMFVYDIGYAIVDKRGKIYRTRSFVNADIFIGEKDLMQSAYYAKKIPNYWQEIKEGKRILLSFYKIREILKKDIEDYNIKEIYAHNMLFDLKTLNNTQRWLTKSKYRYFFPFEIKICDTMKMSRDVIAKMPTYKRFCQENGYVTKNGKERVTAEILYKFISKDEDFEEKHTGLEDVMIEKEILAYCFKQHKKMRKELFNKVG